MKKILFLFWLISLLVATIYTYENPEKIDSVKKYFKNKKAPSLGISENQGKISEKIEANAFNVIFSKIISFPDEYRTAFVIYDDLNNNFNKEKIKIYSQNGYKFFNTKYKRIPLPNVFTTDLNGGIKTIFTYKDNVFALISSLKNDCYYASIIFLKDKSEIFKTKCLPDDNIDFNGLGSANIHYKNKILLSIGAPESINSKVANLAQNKDSFFGKIIEIDKNNLDKIISKKNKKIFPKIFSMGHRNPQGLTIMNENIFSVEHGPRGGDELNKIIFNKNYGWPKSSYGIRYLFDKNKNLYNKNHEEDFEEPIFAFVPSIGISSLNNCPKKLKKYYNKPCLLALSLYGNSLRPGKSIIIYLLDNKMEKIHSIEKIFLGDDYKLRHFVTNDKNELYEDENGDIYISVDRKGIYKINFMNL